MTDEQCIDWVRLEPDYRAGVLSLRYLAAKYGCSLGAITRRAKRDGWRRGVAAPVIDQVENTTKAGENSQTGCSLTADSVREQSRLKDRVTPELEYRAAQQRYRHHVSDCRLAAGVGHCPQCLALSTQRDITYERFRHAQDLR